MQATERAGTAVLLFVREEDAEQRVKRWVKKAAAGMRVSRLLNARALAVARRSGLPVHIIKGSRQRGATFGERFANAFEELFAAGYQRVIAIGNDSPQLRPSDLFAANRLLERHAWVIGPAYDGGAYLVAIDRAAYNRSQWLEAPWETARVDEALQQLAAEAGYACAHLRHLTDADGAEALRQAWSALAKDHWLYGALRMFLFCASGIFAAPTPAPILRYWRRRSLGRAPPAHGR
jgi:glycosyltransferase A (GT-A) superfamily protein (DUF2064 family)